MDIFLKRINRRGSELELHEYFARILHNPPYLANPGDTPVNFKVRLLTDGKGDSRGMANLTISNAMVAEALLRSAYRGALPQFQGSSVQMQRNNRPLDKVLVKWLQSTPYKGPGPLRRLQERRDQLGQVIEFHTIAFGWIDRDDTFSIEWEPSSFGEPATLSFNAINSTVDIQFIDERPARSLGDNMISRFFALEVSSTRCQVSSPFSQLETLRHLETTEASYIEITFQIPPAFSKLASKSQNLFNPVQQGTRVRGIDIGLPKRTSGFISLALLITLPPSSHSAIENFREMASYIGLDTVLMHSPPEKRRHFSEANLDAVENWVSNMKWPASFHCASLLHNWLLSAKELCSIRPFIEMCTSGMPSDTLERFFEYLGMSLRSIIGERVPPGSGAQRLIKESLESCVRTASESAVRPSYQSTKLSCLSVKVTPTRVVLEGPFPEQSNRVLRVYAKNNDAFIRVHFTDEDQHPFRMASDIDHRHLVKKLVNESLKTPLVVAGRKFNFLAYSNSALRQHSVWFVADFEHPELGRVTASTIRRGLGNFNRIITCPARVGARMSQAFTSTDSTIIAEKIELIPDITSQVYDVRLGKVTTVNFTDGIGTISKETAEKITRELEERSFVKRRQRLMNSHSAFQIRLGGHKGMLSVDYTHHGPSIRIRDSMTKFKSDDFQFIEVAQTFERPKPAYLNRPLIMVLETLGVRAETFKRLQDRVISSVKDAASTLVGAYTLLQTYNLGRALKVPQVLSNLHKFGFKYSFSDFFRRAMKCVVYDILRALKYKARILLPNGYTLVGVADIHRYLNEGEIFACICHEGHDPIFLEGRTLITRSPCMHPGDVQLVKAIGCPPRDSPFFHEPLRNCVVFPCQGTRSLPQSLGGGDLDGDEYTLIQVPELFPPRTVTPAAYEPAVLNHLPSGGMCNLDTNNEVADFVTDFIINDILGVIAIRNLIIADQSEKMSEDPDCLFLAELASQAVDFQKSGTPTKYRRIPKERSKLKPDWCAGEGGRERDTYPSPHALGVLYRAISLEDMNVPTSKRGNHELERVLTASKKRGKFLFALLSPTRLQDPISRRVQRVLLSRECSLVLDERIIYEETLLTIHHFSYQLRDLSYRMSLKTRPLTEEECWAGVVLDKSRIPKVRQDRQADLVEWFSRLCEETRRMLVEAAHDGRGRLERYWSAWLLSKYCEEEKVFGANSLQFLILGEIFAA